MRIKRYNESLENWDINKLFNFYKQKEYIHKKEININFMLKNFFSMNLHYIENIPSYKPGDLKFNFEEGFDVYVDFTLINDNKLQINFSWDDGDEGESIIASDELLNDIVNFINNPEMYKNAKQYNLDITNNEIQILIKRKNIGGSYRFYLKGEEKKEFEQFSEFFLDLKQYNL